MPSICLQFEIDRLSALRFTRGLVCVFLCVVAGVTPGNTESSDTPSIVVYDFQPGFLNWNGDWDTDDGLDSYASFYRVDRLRGGYIIRDHRSFSADAAHDYFREQIDQIVKPYRECGFWDDENKNWIRKLLWSETAGWCGMVPHDWKYSLELEEGALMASIVSGVRTMDIFCAGELEYIHAHVNPDGSVDDLIPDDDPCEYGLALSSLALGARLFTGRTVLGYDGIGEQAYEDMKRVRHCIGKNLVIRDEPNVGTSYVLKGLVNAYLAYSGRTGTERERIRLLGTIEELAACFRRNQEPCGRFRIGSGGMERYPVQQQLKADIALLLAHRVNGDESLAAAAKRNLDWVMSDRLDRSGKCMGGVVWATDDSTSFFECHQMWFMIALTYLEAAVGCDYSMCRAEAFTFLTDDNFAGIDLYDHNATRNGAFFAYRMISADGTIQNDPAHCFKGAYEIGASLWAMALNYDLFVKGYTRLITQPPAGESNGWDKAIFTERDFGSGDMIFQWDVQFMDASSGDACTGLFNDRHGDWRVMLSTESGLRYRNTRAGEIVLLDHSRLHSNRTYTVRVTTGRLNRALFVVFENGTEIMSERRCDMMPFDACYFGALQRNAGAAPAKNILVDNVVYRRTIYPPRANRLAQNVPNPFNAHTTIPFDVGRAGHVTLDIYDSAGRFIKRLIDAPLARSSYTAFWNGTDRHGRAVASGVYFYILRDGRYDERRKMVLIR